MKKIILILIAMLTLISFTTSVSADWYNISADKTCSAPSDSGGDCANALDGEKTAGNIGWYDENDLPLNFWIDLGASYCIGTIEMIAGDTSANYYNSYFPKRIQYQYSTDNLVWSNFTIIPSTDYINTTPTRPLPSGAMMYRNFTLKGDNITGANARYLRVNITTNWAGGISTNMEEITFFQDTTGASCGTPPIVSGIDINITQPVNDTGFNLENMTEVNGFFRIIAKHNESRGWITSINSTDFTLESNTSKTVTYVNNTLLSKSLYHVRININKTNTTNGTENVIFFIDIVDPQITTDFLGKKIVVLDNNKRNLTAWVNVSDTNLYSLKINDSIGGLIFYVAGITTPTYNYSLNINVSNRTTGMNEITVTVADGHTSKEIPTWKYNKDIFSKAITYDYSNKLFSDKYVKITPESLGLFDSFDTQKEKDRYTFSTTPNVVKKTMSFLVTSSHYIDIIERENVRYNGWLVIPELNKWIDFELDKASGKEIYTIQRVNQNNVRVTVTNLDGRNTYLFKSIGDLNIVTQTYEWFLVNATETYASQLLIENDKVQYKLNITKNSSINTSASFFYNGTLTPVTKTSTAANDVYKVTIQHGSPAGYNGSLPMNWTYNVTSNASFEKYSINRTLNIYNMIVGNCNTTNINTTVINFSIVKEKDSTAITGVDFSGLFTIWRSANTSYTKNFGFDNNSLPHSHKDICIFPWFGNYVTNYQTLFEHNSYDDTHYTVNSGYLNMTKQTVIIYMVNTTESTAITVGVVDENDNKLPNYLVEVYKYILAENNYTLIDSQATDSNGQSKFNLDVSTSEYRFIVKNPSGTIVYTGSKQKLIDTEYTLRVIIGTSPVFIEAKLRTLNIELTTDRTNKNFTLTWSDIKWATNYIKFIVSTQNLTSNTSILSTQTSTADSGTITYHITESTANRSVTYWAGVYLSSIDDDKEYLYTSDTMDFKKEWDIFGTESLFAAFIFVGTIIFIGAAVSATGAIVLAILGLVAMWALGFYMISAASLVGIILALIVYLVLVRKE